MTVQQFMEQAKTNAKAKAIQMAKLELSIWDANHELQLKQFHGFTETTLQKRKQQLTLNNN